MKQVLLAAAAAAVGLSACAGMPMTGPRSAGMERMGTQSDMMPTNAMEYVRMAGASDLYEIQSSQIALQRSQNPQVRSFAQMMIADHTRTSAEVMAAARADGITPPAPMLDPMKRDMIARLQGQQGAAFDRLYLEQQMMAHQQALSLHQTFAARGDTMALRAVAARAVPIVQGHLQQVHQMHGRM